MSYIPDAQIKESLALLGITELNPMQQAASEHFHTEKNLVLLSGTGSGKTLAFLLPLLKALNPSIRSKVQALVLSPSRELALQTEQVFRSLRSDYKISCFYGGHPMKTEKQSLQQPPAVMVGTPGRIADHLRRQTFRTDGILYLVIDEFDKALELGFEEDMRFITGQLPALQKRMLTSATTATDIPPFMQMEKACYLNFLPRTIVSGLRIYRVPVQKSPTDSLYRLLCTTGTGSVLVFCNFREKAGEISAWLKRKGVDNAVFHGGLEQDERERSLVRFRNGSIRVLVCTDLAARGLDIPEVEHIIHLQLPADEESFIHRNGRTARMHAEGRAYLLAEEAKTLPAWIPDTLTTYELHTGGPAEPVAPAFVTLHMNRGRKDKLRKVDIVGFLLQKGGLQSGDLGLIEVKDHFAYVALKKEKAASLLQRIAGERIKNIQVRTEISR